MRLLHIVTLWSALTRCAHPRQDWPNTCLLNVGQAHERFADLKGAKADEFLAVSCGVNGYIPDSEGPDSEWERNLDYFGPDP